MDDAGDMRGARTAYRAATRLAPQDLRGPLFEGQMLLRRRRHAEAAEILTPDALDSNRRPTLVYFQLTLQALVASGKLAARTRSAASTNAAVEVHGARPRSASARRERPR